ncbi:MAG: FdhF/YdeP family oxidoreductase [Pseudomonadota bacterium]|nr:FdhF/YdeP family oxidoreductase [Pseudomonadota bacterium]
MAKKADSQQHTRPKSAAGPRAVAEVVRQLIDKPQLKRGVQGLSQMNQPAGFDCPGCAWPEDPNDSKLVDFCENGAKAFANEATKNTADAQFFSEHSIADLSTKSDRWLNDQGRLSQPMVRHPDSSHYKPIDWVDAYQLIANHFSDLKTPNEAAFYTSGRTSNEAAFLWQLFARLLGTNNMPDCSNMCHESSGTALKEVIGSGKGTVRLSDFDHADLIFVFGQNPGSNHPRMLATLQKAKKLGAKIISVNPLDEVGLRKFRNPQTVSGWVGAGDDLCDLHLPIRINGDVALLQGLCKAMLELDQSHAKKILDWDFIDTHTEGFDAYKKHLEQTAWSSLTSICGLDQSLIEQAASISASADRTICCWAMGITQHQNAVSNIQEIVNFLLLRGNFGKEGAGACPVRGHSNVQGDRTMGIWEKPEPQFLNALSQEFHFTAPSEPGMDTVDSLQAMSAGKIKIFLAMGGNFLAAVPDTAYSSQAVKNCSLTVQISTTLNRSHVVGGDTAIILPTLGRSEKDMQKDIAQFITTENSMGLVSKSSGVITPVSSDLKSEIRIVSELADVVLKDKQEVNWLGMANDYNLIRDRIERVIPGFEQFNARLAETDCIELPHPVRDKLSFITRSGKAIFTVHDSKPVQVEVGQYVMMTIRSHDQFNTTVYSQTDRYRGIKNNRRVVFMNSEDIADAGLAAGMKVRIASHYIDKSRSMTGFSILPYDIPRGCVATYYPETNPLIPIEQVAFGSNTPAYKSVPVTINADIH